jgi:hypothetical protein
MPINTTTRKANARGKTKYSRFPTRLFPNLGLLAESLTGSLPPRGVQSFAKIKACRKSTYRTYKNRTKL